MRIPSLALAAIVLAGVALTPAAASGRVPQGFVGVMADGPMFGPPVDLGHEFDRMVGGGVESLRVLFNWSTAQPYGSFATVPPDRVNEFQDVGGVPTDFTRIDRVVALASLRGLRVLPVVEYAPDWDSEHPGNRASPPISPFPYASFMVALIQRYGPSGTFWTENPKVPRMPIRRWQIWNEPNIEVYWSDQPNFLPKYVSLLRAAHDAVKSADPGAQVVLAGMPDYVWQYLSELYKVPGARKLFDIVAVHPYTAQADGVIKILRLVRSVMNRNGDRHKPMLATEVSWPSGHGTTKFGFETSEAGQAKRLARLLPRLAQYRASLGLIGFFYYTWIGVEPSTQSFDYAGLLRLHDQRLTAKPAYAAFRSGALAMERCRRKGSVATHCAQPAR